MSELPKWPELATYRHYDTKTYEWVHDFADYERARAEAAIARLKVAVGVLKNYGSFDGNLSIVGIEAREALALIGELPE